MSAPTHAYFINFCIIILFFYDIIRSEIRDKIEIRPGFAWIKQKQTAFLEFSDLFLSFLSTYSCDK